LISDMDLIELQAAVLFRYDTAGRVLSHNEPEPDQPAPRLFLGRTSAGNIWRFRHDLPHSLVHDLDRLLKAEPIASDLRQPPRTLPCVLEALEAHAPVQDVSMGPAWRFPERIEPVEGVVPISEANVEALRAQFPWTAAHLEEYQPCMAVIVGGEAVSLCFSSRLSPNAAEAGVNTVERFRARGYAMAVVAAWAHAVRESNRVPLYSTSRENLASQAVARKLGLVLYGADLSIT
jgi:RimJ/RimL family protein N-acetyltransferase